MAVVPNWSRKADKGLSPQRRDRQHFDVELEAGFALAIQDVSDRATEATEKCGTKSGNDFAQIVKNGIFQPFFA